MGHQSAWQPKHDGLGGGKVRSNKQAQKHWEANTCGRMLEHLLQRKSVRERSKHKDYGHKGGGDSWTQVKHQEGQETHKGRKMI